MLNKSYAKLFIAVIDKNNNIELYNKYENAITVHNNSVINKQYPDSGFDIFFPNAVSFQSAKSEFAKMGIVCGMKIYDQNKEKWASSGYYSYPRSSISKTPLMLANHVGIIDSGYRGPLIGAFRNIASQVPYVVEEYTRLLQICAPDLRPIIVELVEESFFEETERGSGGFGSTGI